MEEEFKKDENFWEEKNSSAPMLIIMAVLLALGVGTYIFITKFMNDDSKNNPSTKSDDATISDDATVSDDSETTTGKKIYIYAKGFADNGPIAFTYNCISENCNILTTEKGIILYDEDKVQYRELTKYEYEQINNSDSPVGGNLEKDGFKTIVPTRIFELDKYEANETDKQTHNLYKIEKENYFLTNEKEGQSIYNFKDYCEYYKDKCLYDNQLIGYYNQIYDLKTDTFIHELEDEGQRIETIENNQSFVIVRFTSENHYFYLILNEKYKLVLNTYKAGFDSYYLKNEQLYYINQNKIIIENAKGEKTEYDNTDMTAVKIAGSLLLYYDKNNNINIRNLNTNEDTYKSDINIPSDLIEMFFKTEDNKYELLYTDFNALKTDEWFNNVDKEHVGEEFNVNAYKSCTNENYKENNNCRDYVIGYTITFDKDGKYISKENFLGFGGI